MLFEVSVDVMPLEALLDPQGKAVQNTVSQIGYSQVQSVRVGKHIVVKIEAKEEEEARKIANELCSKILSNPVMEGFSFQIKALSEGK